MPETQDQGTEQANQMAMEAPQGAAIGAAPDQQYKPYIGVKLIHAYPCEKWIAGLKHEGYAVKYADSYESWSPKAAFEAAYFGISTENSITPLEIERFMGTVTADRIDPKTCLVKAEHLSGFVQYNPSSCVDPNNYSEEMGKKVGVKKIQDGLWFALGFVLQWGKYGLKK